MNRDVVQKFSTIFQKMSEPILAVLFDAGGVLFRSFDDKGRFLWTLNSLNDIGLTEEQIGASFKTGFSDVLTGKVGTLDYFEKVFENEPYKSAPVTTEEFVEYWLEKDANVNIDTLALADRVTVPKYMATNQEFMRLAKIQTLLGSHFKQIFASVELGVCKPDTAFFKRIADILELPPRNILMIDDDAKYLLGAQTVGMQCHLFEDCPSLEAYLDSRGLID